ncbi:LruC domain-containing protein [Bacteroidota bacterium]
MVIKNSILSLIIIIAIPFLSYGQGQNPVSNNFAISGGVGTYEGECWDFNNDFKVNNSGINGKTGKTKKKLTDNNPDRDLTTPWILFDGNSSTLIEYDTKMSDNNGSWVRVDVLKVDTNLNETIINTYNFSGTWTQVKNISFSETIDGIYKLIFRFNGSGAKNGYIDNINIAGTYHSDPTNNCTHMGTADPDSDGDGVPDATDDYPNDATRAYNNYIPAYGQSSLSFEDMWPIKGDYDFNDVVLDYQFQIVTNASNNVVEILGDFELRATGAGFTNGFGFNLPNADNDLINDLSTSGMTYFGGNISNNSDGLENSQTHPTIIITDNIKNAMGYFGTGMVNSDPDEPFVQPVTITITMTIDPNSSNTYTITDLALDTFNPFIIVNDERGREVHLPDYPPTDLADNSYFGTGDDASNPGSGIYYKTSNNLPWGIEIPEQFDYPKERIDIVNAHLKFADWAISGGSQYQQWYQNQSGYRNSTNVY